MHFGMQEILYDLVGVYVNSTELSSNQRARVLFGRSTLQFLSNQNSTNPCSIITLHILIRRSITISAVVRRI